MTKPAAIDEAIKALGCFEPSTFTLKQDKTLWFVTSTVPELKGLLVAGHTAEEAIAQTPAAIIQLLYVQLSCIPEDVRRSVLAALPPPPAGEG